MLHTHTHVAADLCLRSKKKERKQMVEGSTAVKKSFDNNKLQLDKQKRSTMKILFHRQYFNCHMNQSDKSFFWQLEPNKKPNEFLLGQETKKRFFSLTGWWPLFFFAPMCRSELAWSALVWTTCKCIESTIGGLTLIGKGYTLAIFEMHPTGWQFNYHTDLYWCPVLEHLSV